jgi:predicted metalloprotease with PDZ domain
MRLSMKLSYKLSISEPWTHYVKIRLSGTRPTDRDYLDFFLPSWSPGSYLMREYAKGVRKFRALTGNGEFLYFEKKEKGTWRVDWSQSELKGSHQDFSIEYEVYCHEVSVRTSHITEEHAFLHGPSILMGLVELEIERPTLEIEFPPLWSKVTTGLKDISDQREKFLYQAQDYDELIDSPIEIGCHETNGFRVNGIDHHLAYYDWPQALPGDLRKDTQAIVEKVSEFWGEIPYSMYVFMGHFIPGIYGGLEHLNSTALQFDPFLVQTEDGYRDFLGLVAHEYFHTWNVKRIRPKELGPFDYRNENYTKMHWLTEGMTSFVDDLFVFSAGLSTLEQYLTTLTKRIQRYLLTPGRKFDSLEDSSFDAWIKLYRPDENSRNSSISYYLKGQLAFYCLNILLVKEGKTLKDLCGLLWNHFKAKPSEGLVKEDFFRYLKEVGGEEVANAFEGYIAYTTELPLEELSAEIGLNFKFKDPKYDFGFEWQEKGEQLFVSQLLLDGPAYKSGLNAGDEILAVDGFRITTSVYKSWLKSLKSSEKLYTFQIARLGKIRTLEVSFGPLTPELDKIEVVDEKKAMKALKLI